MIRMLAVCSVVCTALVSCAVDSSDDRDGSEDSLPGVSKWQPLVDATLWQETAPQDDPLAEHRGNSIVCPESAWYPEPGGVEIETTACAYVSLSQPLGENIAAGDMLHVVAWWQTLVSVEPALGHLAVLIGNEIVWDEHIDIPGKADARVIEFVAGSSFAAGETVTFHLHNHGFNTWTFSELARKSGSFE